MIENRIRQTFTQLILPGLILMAFILVTIPGMNTAAVKSDSTLGLYASQQIARGIPPYANYIIFQPPIAHFFGAIVLSLGQFFGLNDILSIRYFCLVLSLSVLISNYFLGDSFEKGLGLLSMTAAGWNLLMVMTIWGVHTKLVMAFFYSLMLFSLMKKNWFFAGVFSGLTTFTWAGGVFSLIVVFMVGLLAGKNRLNTVFKLMAGILLVTISLLLILWLSGSMQPFFDQYAIPLKQYLVNKLLSRGIRDPQMGFLNVFQTSSFSRPDLFIVVAGLVSLVIYSFQNKKHILDDLPFLTLLIAVLIGVGMVIVDFQSPFDCFHYLHQYPFYLPGYLL